MPVNPANARLYSPAPTPGTTLGAKQLLKDAASPLPALQDVSLPTRSQAATSQSLDITSLFPIMQTLLQLMSKLVSLSGQSPFKLPDALPAATQTAGLPTDVGMTSTQKPASLKGADFQGTLNIAVIDSFSDSTHGDEIASTLLRGGADAGLSGKIKLEKFDVRGGSVDQINAHLETIIQNVEKGETVDAVNISQQALNASGNTGKTSQLVDTLSSLGIPVAVAAGNGGASAHNYLTGTQSFNVSSATNGRQNVSSGRGNVLSEGATTSLATANLTPLLALRHRLGLSNGAIQTELGRGV